MNINWKELLTKQFWFEIDRVMIHRIDKAFLMVGLALFVIGLILKIVSRFTSNQFSRRIVSKVGSIALVVGFFEAVWYGLRYQYVNVLGTHFVAALILLIGLLWLIPTVRYWIKKYPNDVADWQKELQRNKYLSR